MNTKSISRFFGLLTSFLLLLATTNTTAQTKEEFSSLYILNQSQVNPNVIKSFEQKFKNATPVNWYRAKENNVLVKYIQKTQTQYALFTVNGTLVRQFTYGAEHNLPLDIKALFRDKFWKGTIVNVANVKQDSRDVWIIYAQQGNHSFAVKIEDGQVEGL
jgi:hypothetical protein